MVCWFNTHYYLFPIITSLSLCIFIFVVRFEVLTVVFTEDLSPLECYALLVGK